jgi:ElaB/YqjD/DUF883 family membrane-anchored ribosome-binding protein
METETKKQFELPGALTHDAQVLLEHARELLDVTKDVADEKISIARKRLKETLESGANKYGDLQEKVTATAKAADQTVREHPYEAIAIAFGVGALVGFLVSRRK